ncbi:MAG: glycosyltransferase family 2 protein [Rikenellaceae bacterium]
MNGIKYKLSIIIPTYNGAEWIEDGVRSIAKQIADKPYVEFLIRDNASTDCMQELVVKLQAEYGSTIKYNRRHENTPELDINFKEAIDLSSGEYIWLIGDDDLLLPYAVDQVLSLIDKHPDVGWFYSNRIVSSFDYKRLYIKETNCIYPCFEKKYKNTSLFIGEHINGPDFISVNIIKRDLYNDGCKYIVDKYYGYEWYAKYLFGSINTSAIYISQPIVLQRLPKVRSWGKKSVLYALLGLSNLFQDYSKISGYDIYSIWMNYLHKKSGMPITLSGLTKNRALYKKKYNEIRIHLNRKEQCIAILLLYCPPFKYINSAIIMLKKKLNLL